MGRHRIRPTWQTAIAFTDAKEEAEDGIGGSRSPRRRRRRRRRRPGGVPQPTPRAARRHGRAPVPATHVVSRLGLGTVQAVPRGRRGRGRWKAISETESRCEAETGCLGY
jgi:hypothetical protein